MITAPMLRHVAVLLLLGDLLCATQACRNCSDLVRALVGSAELVWRCAADLRLLDVLGVWIVDHNGKRGVCG